MQQRRDDEAAADDESDVRHVAGRVREAGAPLSDPLRVLAEDGRGEAERADHRRSVVRRQRRQLERKAEDEADKLGVGSGCARVGPWVAEGREAGGGRWRVEGGGTRTCTKRGSPRLR